MLGDFLDRGDGNVEQLLPLVYDELRAVASSFLARERHGHTLQPTALVHEAYLRIVEQTSLGDPDGDPHRRFIGLAANAMRRILVEHARRRGSEKRGGDWQRVALLESLAATSENEVALLDLENAMQKLQQVNERLARIAELRLFGGLTIRELAPVVGVSATVASDDWQFARAMLGKMMSDAE